VKFQKMVPAVLESLWSWIMIHKEKICIEDFTDNWKCWILYNKTIMIVTSGNLYVCYCSIVKFHLRSIVMELGKSTVAS
jgi:hypothetical protein